MRNTYLTRLGLEPGATKGEIKRVYRTLSKKYHPDVNPDPNAKEQFIEINEAYKFLMEVGPRPNREPVRYDYDSEAAEYERWRRRAREYARWKHKEAERRKIALIKYLLYWFDFVAVSIVVFNLLLTIDYFLPRKAHDEKIISISAGYEGSARYGKPQHRYDDVKFQHYRMRFDKGEVIHLDHYEKAMVVTTYLLDSPLAARITADGVTTEHIQIYGIYRVFIYIIPAMFVVALFYQVVLKSVDHKLTMAIFMCILEICQLLVFFLY